VAAGSVITLPAAEFAVSVAIAVKLLSTNLALQMVPGFSVDSFRMGIPPGGAAAVRAEVFLPFALGLLEGCAACPAPTLLNLFSMPLTKGFDGWDRNFQKL
jgi:hypothetical protein